MEKISVFNSLSANISWFFCFISNYTGVDRLRKKARSVPNVKLVSTCYPCWNHSWPASPRCFHYTTIAPNIQSCNARHSYRNLVFLYVLDIFFELSLCLGQGWPQKLCPVRLTRYFFQRSNHNVWLKKKHAIERIVPINYCFKTIKVKSQMHYFKNQIILIDICCWKSLYT